MIIALIAAVAKNNVIGMDNDLVWHLPDDMKHFMQTTVGHCVLTGRRNYESIPKKYRPLKNRTNIVITRKKNYSVDEAVILVGSIDQGIEIARGRGENELFIIGGGQIYQQTINRADRLYLTEVHGEFEGDTHFPEVDLSKWREISRSHHPVDEKHAQAFDMVVWERPGPYLDNQGDPGAEEDS